MCSGEEERLAELERGCGVLTAAFLHKVRILFGSNHFQSFHRIEMSLIEIATAVAVPLPWQRRSLSGEVAGE
jgi:hypothetical protein